MTKNFWLQLKSTNKTLKMYFGEKHNIYSKICNVAKLILNTSTAFKCCSTSG